MDIEVFEKIVIKFFTMEISENPHLYCVEMLRIPVQNPRQYIEEKVEKIRRRLAAVIIRNFLSKQKGKGKVLLYKIIDYHLGTYMKEYKMKIMHDHYKSWYVITVLEEMRAKNKSL